MNRTLPTLLLSACAPAFATTMPDGTEDVAGWCGKVYNSAHYIMEQRQKDRSMPELFKEANSVPAEAARVYYIGVVFDAFSEPSWGHPESQERTTKRFANTKYLNCLKSNGQDM